MATIVRLTPAQLAFLRTCLEHPDGTCLAGGFQRTTHAEATAKALTTRGLVTYLFRRSGFFIYQITPAGREAVAG